ncbi:MAG: class I SAM-dependent methyltransferase [Mycobacterium sp.]
MNDVAVLPDGVTLNARPVTPSTILAKELGELCRELADSGVVDPRVLNRLRMARDLAAGLDPYLDRCTTPESQALAELARRTRETDWGAPAAGGGRLEQEMLSGHVEGQTLKFLIHLADAKRVLEIGMFTGYSALAMAEALPEDGVVVACEIDPAVAAFARECFDDSADGHKISVEVGPAIDSLRRLASQSDDAPGLRFDFVFVDADKPGYLDYVEFLLTSDLLSPRAVIAVDNTLLQGQPYAEEDISVNGAAIASFNAALTYDERVEQVLIPLRDGLTLIRRAQA